MDSRKKSRFKKKMRRVIRRILLFVIDHRLLVMIAAGVFVLLLVFLIVFGSIRKGKNESEPVQEEQMEESVGGENGTGEEGMSGDSPADTDPELPEPLAKNAHDQVNHLAAEYFTALQGGDKETIQKLRDNTAPKELLRMQVNSEYISAYKNLACYTKSGLEPESYVAFIYYEVQFGGYETLLPGLTPLYIARNEAGNLYLHDLSIQDEISAYVAQVAAQEDVKELYAQVGMEYQTRLAAQTELAEFVAEYSDRMNAAVGTALEENTAESGSPSGGSAPETSPEQTSQGSSTGTASVPNSGSFTVSDTLNVRKSASETADRIGVCYPGETLEILEKQADGWTRVKFDGQTGYIKTSVLK